VRLCSFGIFTAKGRHKQYKILIFFHCIKINARVSQKIYQNNALTADGHLVSPGLMGLTFADRAVNEPAELTGLKFPGRASQLTLCRAFFYNPAWFDRLFMGGQSGEQEKDLSLNMGGDPAPALLVTVYGLNGDPEEIGYFFLGYGNALAGRKKVGTGHMLSCSLVLW
jgi:hypothetical protein